MMRSIVKLRILIYFPNCNVLANFNLEEFFGYLVQHLLNFAMYYKKAEMYGVCYKYFVFCYRATKHLESTMNPSLLRNCAKARIAFGVFYLEFGK